MNATKQTNETLTRLSGSGVDASWPLQRLELKVLDLDTALHYYLRLGFSKLGNDEGSDVAALGFGPDSSPALKLRQLRDGRSRPSYTTGLYHFALLLPHEAALGSFLRHVVETGIPLDGMSDHVVSQALYLSDPEGNGIEIYADRPRDAWEWEGNHVVMSNRPLNVHRLLEMASPWEGFPPDTRLGHMHLVVSDLDSSQAFYEKLGMQVTADWGPFRFMSWNGYHHHLGLNTTAGRGARPVQGDFNGLHSFDIVPLGLSKESLIDPNGIRVATEAH